ncbi:Retrovirus-related Pol polyprotein from transposon RE1 [Vitis vinifera]|uniref:Retrovirus-related Pol polyprotein from transposon RE1 n=1 Tax=Vitis vinifera TaxID=29760 RepID=A0A438G5P8_VITVI|nr:Retrovirus-related Pol polyprotein from transposon RE1 [Vitis vinifera]
MKLKSWIFCRYGSPTAINHPKTSPNIDKSTFKCTHCNKTGPTSLDIPQFQSNDFGMTRKTIRNQGFEPWTFRSCLGYQHFVINYNNRDQRKKDSKKTTTATVAEIKIEANVAEKASALVAATNHGDRFHPLDLPHKKLFPQPMDIQTRQTIGCGIKRGKLYYLDLQSKDSNKLQQALMADGSEGEKKKSEIWLWHRRLGHASFDVFTEIPNQTSSGQSELVNQEVADPRWKAAMNEEMKSLQKNETWELVECPPGKKPVGCRWIYTVKYKANGANLDWPLQQFDVKNAFLHGELFEEVYMDLPPGCMVSEKQCQKVCKLKKSLYGLKQSPRAWFGRFTKSMRAFGYRQSNSDHTLFLKKQHGKITTLIVYVDDMVVTGNDPEERKALQNYLSREFKMKDLGHLKYFLGIEVSRSSEGIFLSQRKYALDLLQETGMSGCQPVNTPIEEGLKLCVEPNQVSTDKGRYQRLVGRLMYLAHTDYYSKSAI